LFNISGENIKLQSMSENNSIKPLVNRVANSGLININLEEYYPKSEFDIFDLTNYLFQGLILKEKDFRTSLKSIDWTKFKGKILLVYCSSDAIIPVWAYMLVATYAEPYADQVFQGTQKEFLIYHYNRIANQFDDPKYNGERIVIKGCSKKDVPPTAYSAACAVLRKHAQSIMYGEPCSTVPVFKRPRQLAK